MAISIPDGTVANPINVTGGGGGGGGGAVTITNTGASQTAQVKAASTAAVATDPALVVVESPNKPAVSTSAQIGVVSAVLKASAGNLRSLYAANRSAAGLWLQFQNQTTAVTNAASAVLQFYVPPSGQIVIGNDFFVDAGWPFSTGISWGFSTVTTTYTAYGTAANVDMQATYL